MTTIAEIEAPHRTFSAEEAGFIPGWSPAGALVYNPYGDGHVLRMTRSHVTPVVLSAFLDPAPIELCFDSTGVVTFGLAWTFVSVPGAWSGTVYSWSRDEARYPVLQCADHRLMPPASRLFRCQLLDPDGNLLAERRIMAPTLWCYLFNEAVAASASANANWRDHLRLATEALVQRYPLPADLAHAVTREAAGWAPVNQKRFQHCVTTDLGAEEAVR
jgi:hypothetical protein